MVRPWENDLRRQGERFGCRQYDVRRRGGDVGLLSHWLGGGAAVEWQLLVHEPYLRAPLCAIPLPAEHGEDHRSEIVETGGGVDASTLGCCYCSRGRTDDA